MCHNGSSRMRSKPELRQWMATSGKLKHVLKCLQIVYSEADIRRLVLAANGYEPPSVVMGLYNNVLLGGLSHDMLTSSMWVHTRVWSSQSSWRQSKMDDSVPLQNTWFNQMFPVPAPYRLCSYRAPTTLSKQTNTRNESSLSKIYGYWDGRLLWPILYGLFFWIIH